MLEFWTIATNAMVAVLYVVLGLIILPRVLINDRKPVRKWAMRAALTVFAVGCALTHAEIALHGMQGHLSQAEQVLFLVTAIPQVLGGLLFLLAAISFGREELWAS